MAGLLVLIGVIWFIWKIAEEASWNTHAYDNKGYDVSKAFNDACVKRVSKSEFKKNYKSGKYSK